MSRLMNNVTRVLPPIEQVSKRNLNSSRYMETLNTEENSVSIKWSIDNLSVEELMATYLTLSFKVNRLALERDWQKVFFATFFDELDSTFETVSVSTDWGIETQLGKFELDGSITTTEINRSLW